MRELTQKREAGNPLKQQRPAHTRIKNHTFIKFKFLLFRDAVGIVLLVKKCRYSAYIFLPDDSNTFLCVYFQSACYYITYCIMSMRQLITTKSQSEWDGVLTRFSPDLYVLLTRSKILAQENACRSTNMLHIFRSNQCTSVE